ncbi:MAG: hypothetical protein ACTSQJ_12010, partial [Promethearchaeota archaeon]
SGVWHRDPGDPVVHRVVNKSYNKEDNKWYFWTKGDNNEKIDEAPVPDDKILGVVRGRIQYIGYIKIWLTDSGLFIPLIVIISTLLIISIIYDIIKEEEEENDDKRKKKEKKVKSIQKKRFDNRVEKEIKEIELLKAKKDDFDI